MGNPTFFNVISVYRQINIDGGPLETLADSTLLLAHNTIPMHVSTIVLLVIIQA